MKLTKVLLIVSVGAYDTYNSPQSSSSLPRSNLLSPIQSSPFSPLLAKFEDQHIIEFDSNVAFAGMAPLDSTALDNDSVEEYYSEGPQFEERGASQPSAMSLATIYMGAPGTAKAKR